MPRILLLFAHPALDRSRVHARLLDEVREIDLTFHDLYEAYPDYDVDVAREQSLLEAHEVVVVQHPLFWYSVPPLVKQWIDLVLEHGWAYGSGGTALQGKRMVNLISAGGGAGAYHPDGYNGATVRQFLLPIEQTARLCGMEYLPPWVVHGTHRLSDAEVEEEADRYRRLLEWLAEGHPEDPPGRDVSTLNEIFSARTGSEGVT